MAADDASKNRKKDKKQAPRGPPVTDARFEAVQWDPRFQRFPKAKRHVEIDKRFEGMFKNPEFQQHSTVDKRGRKVEKRKNQENMRKYYKLKDEDAWREDAAEPGLPSTQAQPSSDASQQLQPTKAKMELDKAPVSMQGDKMPSSQHKPEVEEQESAEALAEQRWARARGLLGDSSSSDEDDDTSDVAVDVGDQEEALEEEWGVGAMAANPDEHIPDSDETHRLAIVDLDWDKIRAVDILAVLRSFLAKGQSIGGVTVYPSDFGLEKMQEEAAIGPQSIFGRGTAVNGLDQPGKTSKLLTNAVGHLSDSDSEAGQSEDDADADADELLAAVNASSEEDLDDDEELDQEDSSEADSGNEVDQRRLQLYERSRLRYYYAVVDCQDVRTAAHLYAECDGMEFLRSACKLDMRFVPEEQDFAKRQVRDLAEEVPSDYTPPDFTTAALQHTNVKLTWDADDDTRKKALRKKMTEDSIRDDDFRAYLASSSEEEAEVGEDAAALRERYRSLLLANTNGDEARTGGPKGRTWGGGDPNSDEEEDSDNDAAEANGDEAEVKVRRKRAGKDMDMEVTFTPGLEGLGARLLAQKKDASQRKGDTVWEAYLRRQKERKLAAKAQGRRHASSDEGESADEAAEENEGGSEGEQDPFFQHDDNAFDDPFFRDSEGATEAPPPTAKTGKPSQKAAGKAAAGAAASKADKAAERQRQAQLELLMMDDSALQDVARLGGKLAADGPEAEEEAGGKRGKQKVSRKERIQRKRDQKRAERQAGSDDEDLGQGKGFEANLQDSRFNSLFTSADFALDPTDPRFQQAEGSTSIAKAVAQQRQQGAPGAQVDARQTDGTAKDLQPQGQLAAPQNGQAPSAGDATTQLKSMVASLKRKSSKASKADALPIAKEKVVKKRKKQQLV